MLRTIEIGSAVTVQGIYVWDLPDGRIAVRVGSKVFTGHPVGAGRPSTKQQKGAR